MKEQMKVSIIIPTYNRQKMLERCLKAIELQSMSKHEFEVIVANDGSPDNTELFLEQFQRNTSLNFRFLTIQNSGPALARNSGLAIATGDFVAFTDDDCVPQKRWIQDLLDAFPDDPKCAGIGGKILGINNTPLSNYIDKYTPLAHVTKDSNIKYLVTANAFYRHNVLKEVGGFEPSFSWPGGEDPEISIRMEDKGYYFLAIEGGLVYHEHRDTLKDIYQTQFRYGMGLGRICQINQEKNSQTSIKYSTSAGLKNAITDFFSRKNIGLGKRFLYFFTDCVVVIGFMRGFLKCRKCKIDEEFNGKGSFYVKNLGCARRGIDGERIKNYFISNGLVQTMRPQNADYMVVITCGLSLEDTKKSVNCINSLKQYDGKLLVCGCLPDMDPNAIKNVYDGETISTRNIDQIDDYFNLPSKYKDTPDANKVIEIYGEYNEKFEIEVPPFQKFIKNGKHFIKSIIIGLGKKSIENLPGGVGFNNNLFTLRISVGCTGKCAYCVIKNAIGMLKSKPIPVIMKELDTAISKKQYRLNIISSDTGAYGVDIGSNLPELLNAILNKDKKIEISFIQDVNPFWIYKHKDEMVRLFKTKRIESILTPIQSGSDNVLKLMNRYSKTENIIETLQYVKKECPYMKIRTQVIVGFPGETEEDFKETVAFFDKVKFDEVDIFPYFEVKGSAAEKIFPKVDKDVINKRVRILQDSLDIPFRYLSSVKFKKNFRWYYSENDIVKPYRKVKI